MNHSTLNHGHPMASARIVRVDRFGWPGGYPLALVTTDGGMLCPTCVRENFAAVSWSHRNNCSDGWQPAGIACGAETDDEMRCDHCGKVIQEAWDAES